MPEYIKDFILLEQLLRRMLEDNKKIIAENDKLLNANRSSTNRSESRIST